LSKTDTRTLKEQGWPDGFWGWCKACRVNCQWHTESGMWITCPAGHYGGWNGKKPADLET